MDDWVWSGCCYSSEPVYPFGFCYKCWVKYGKPEPMGGID